MKCPCMKCQDRKVGCHCECDRYAEFRKFMDEIAKQRNNAALVNSYETKRINSLIRTRHLKKNGRSG